MWDLLAKAWESILVIWAKIGPVLFLIAAGAAGYLLRWSLDLLSEHLAARREYRHKITELMVPKLQQYTEEHYMPTVSYGRRVSESLRSLLQAGAAAQDEQIVRTLFHIGKFFQAQEKWTLAIGGFFFQNLTGEVVASALQRDLNGKWNSGPALTTQNRSMLRVETGKVMSIGEFLDKVNEQANLQQLREQFRQWLRDPEAAAFLEAVDLWWKLVHFEVNAPLTVWYGQNQRPNLTRNQLSTVAQVLDQLDRNGEIYARHKRQYLKRLSVSSSLARQLDKPSA